jgi:hypothetical protein
VYVEHGAGQTYVATTSHGYAGAEGLDHVGLFVCPSERVASTWRQRYPATPAVAVGCPALDALIRATSGFAPSSEEAKRTARDSGPDVTTTKVSQARGTTAPAEAAAVARDLRVAGAPPLVAITSHWVCGVVPETKPALPHYLDALRELLEPDTRSWQVLGHGHPRAQRATEVRWAKLGVPFEPDPDVVLRSLLAHDQQRVLVADNTSLLYEAAALDVPVLVLNAPWYRRDVEHGLRFWSHVPGVQCDEVGMFLPALEAALTDDERWREVRADASAHVYAAVDGHATERAADAIEAVIGWA